MSKKVFVIGLDGVGFPLITPWLEAGELPHLRELLAEGASGELTSAIPPLTGPAWATFQTGVNPGKHGIFGWTKRRGYDISVVTASDIRYPTLWELASQSGRRVVSIGLPMTYPPREVNGVIIPGMLAPKNDRTPSFPPDAYADLHRAVPGYRFFPESYERIVSSAADTVMAAYEDLAPARVGYVMGSCADAHKDRRCEDGRDYTNDTMPILAVERDGGGRFLLQSSPANRYARNTGTIRASTDDGKSWPYAKVVVPGSFAYSCMALLQDDKIGLLYEAWRSRTIRLMTFSVEEIMKEKKKAPPYPYLSIPVVDLDKDKERQVIVDKEKGQYLGHPTTLLLEDGKTMLVVYPKGHGRGAIVYKRSSDGGLTWSERLPVPASWATSKEVPTLFRTTDKYGKKRIILWSGLYPARFSVSEDDGLTWSELEPAGIWGGIVVMGCMTPVNAGKGHYMAMFHDDMRFFTRDGKGRYEQDREAFNSRMFTLYKTFTDDGGLTWSYPGEVMRSREIHICEPGIIRSPDGTRLAALLRENSRRDHSQIIFSDDEGKTWSRPRPLPNALTGDRHVLKYAPDGRLVVVFRDHSPREYNEELVKIAKEKGENNYSKVAQETGLGSPTEGDWVAWVGTWDDLVKGENGQYRIRLKDNKDGWDCAYPGLEQLSDGTFVTTTYGHWEKGEEPYILSVRFKLEELDKRLNDKMIK